MTSNHLGGSSSEGTLRIAVLFGGSSVEHDVSTMTGLQVMNALDSRRYTIIPVYVSESGEMFTGDMLRERSTYPLNPEIRRKLSQVDIRIGTVSQTKGAPPQMTIYSKSSLPFQSKASSLPFDVAFPTFHGSLGENGAMQGLFEVAGIPYVGSRILASALCMDKVATKHLCRTRNIPVLASEIIAAPILGANSQHGESSNIAKIDFERLASSDSRQYPVCVKPRNLGSSVGVFKAMNQADVVAALVDIFRFDTCAIIEPFVEDLEEYNVSLTSAFGEIRLSAIERPIRKSELLDFKDKYLQQGGTKTDIALTESLAAATRSINPPELTESEEKQLRTWAADAFQAVGANGVVRIDFLCNGRTREMWLNEVNTCPGSLAYFLWEKAKPSTSYSILLDALIDEAVRNAVYYKRSYSALEARANIFQRS